MKKQGVLLAWVIAFALMAFGVARAGNIRGSSEGPITAKGYSHPNHFLHLKPVKPADNMYPVIPHPEQEKEARAKLAALERKTGKKPNILIFIMR